MPFLVLVAAVLVVDVAARGARREHRVMPMLRALLRAAAGVLAVPTPRLRAAPGTRNAFALASGEITVDPRWLEEQLLGCGDDACRDTFSLWLMGHELAHLICGHPTMRRDQRLELDADRLAGFVLGRLGRPPGAIGGILSAMMNHTCSDSHACPSDRIRATWEGYWSGSQTGARAA